MGFLEILPLKIQATTFAGIYSSELPLLLGITLLKRNDVMQRSFRYINEPEHMYSYLTLMRASGHWHTVGSAA